MAMVSGNKLAAGQSLISKWFLDHCKRSEMLYFLPEETHFHKENIVQPFSQVISSKKSHIITKEEPCLNLMFVGDPSLTNVINFDKPHFLSH